MDASASAYISAVTATGVAPTLSQKTAIDTFIKAEKLAGRWASHKRIFLPIWANAAANAIDLVTRATGTFVNGPTHAAGYIQGDGATQYFNLNVSPSSIGQTPGAAGMGYLAIGGGSGTSIAMMGAGTTASGGLSILRWFDTLGIDYAHTAFDTTFIREGAAPISTTYGIISGQAFGGVHRLARRTRSGNVQVNGTPAGVSIQSVPIHNYYMMGYNTDDTPVINSTQQFGAVFLNLGFSAANNDAFTLNLKTLWETCTGLVLP